MWQISEKNYEKSSTLKKKNTKLIYFYVVLQVLVISLFDFFFLKAHEIRKLKKIYHSFNTISLLFFSFYMDNKQVLFLNTNSKKEGRKLFDNNGYLNSLRP